MEAEFPRARLVGRGEQLVARVAVATCFTYSVEPDAVPLEDVKLYVDELIALFRRKPAARTGASEVLPQDVRSTLEFCAERIESGAQDEAAKLRAALSSRS